MTTAAATLLSSSDSTSHQLTMPRLSPLLLLALPSAAVTIVVGAVLALVDVPLWLTAVTAVAAGVLAGLTLRWRAPALALECLSAEPIDPADEPRLVNVVEGLCATFGSPEPKLHRVGSASPNAAIVGRSSKDAQLVVTDGLLDSLDRLELEAVVARLLSQLRLGIEAATVLVAVAKIVSPLGLRDRVLERALDRQAMIVIDLDAVRMTRYPPALASAYETAADIRPIESIPVADHLWLLGTTSGRPRGGAHPPLAERIDVLREL
jgi:Zn-dependent protease with chaperone function